MSEPLILLNYLYDQFNFFSLFGFKKRGPKTRQVSMKAVSA